MKADEAVRAGTTVRQEDLRPRSLGRKHSAGRAPETVYRALRRICSLLLSAAAVLGGFSLLALLLLMLTGTTPVIFRSGSMAPELDIGALALVRTVPANELQPGDVVSVINASGQRITHRVLSIEHPSNRQGTAPEAGAVLQLKGDANPLPDPTAYPVQDAQRVFFSIPAAGYVLAAAQSPAAVFTGGALAALVVFFVLRPAGHATRRVQEQGRHKARTRGRGRAIAAGMLPVLAVAPLPLLAGFPSTGTLAAFGDSSAATSGVLRAAQLNDVPGAIDCRDSSPNSTVSWNPAPALPVEGSYAIQVVRLKTDGSVDKVMGYVGTTGTSYTFGPEGALLGLLSGPTRFRIDILAVVTTSGTVTSDGSNILWSSPVSSEATRSVYNYPGVLLGLGARTQCAPG
ncbi:signal peptidase I [Acaricomes phytoseiuli]|uniref:signal peptidase I n=1 Tax=Acaricomes phytoseiuli TaxID=291968 RepID=UPI002222C677|nr:signal peptidase I [Acaricomes phytoseiuli]MCW1249266.1 signal peptidase I [Acaricomes phytoseiuli]